MRARGAADGEKITANRAAEIALRFLQCDPDSHSVFDNGGLERLRLDEAEYVDMAQFTEKRAAEDCGREAETSRGDCRHAARMGHAAAGLRDGCFVSVKQK